MLAKRIIPCLDVKNGRVVKGVHFKGLRDAGDLVELATRYYREGADELVFLDITATVEGRKARLDWVGHVAQCIFIPFTVGGGISRLEHIEELLKAGADKISINSAAVRHPQLVREASRKFGTQCVVVAVDARRKGNSWSVYVDGGRTEMKQDAVLWAEQVQELGAGEILLTSMDRDGTRQGYDLELLQVLSRRLSIPIIASGGAGSLVHLYEGLAVGEADAVLAASIFHYGEWSVSSVKEYLAGRGLPIRPPENWGDLEDPHV